MRSALIGHTGFVGGNLARQAGFDDAFHSANIEDIEGGRYDLIVCAGAPGTKWKANQEPARDLAQVQRLMDCLGNASAACVVLVSTVDVYPSPVGVDEDTEIPEGGSSPYGNHRRQLERFVEERFEATTVVRLPGLFGPGLKKNVIYDILHQHQLERLCADSVYQFYPIVRLWDDIERARRNGLSVVNFATEPTSVRLLARAAFGVDLASDGEARAVSYDMQTKHAEAFGARGRYLYREAAVVRYLRQFVESAGWKRP